MINSFSRQSSLVISLNFNTIVKIKIFLTHKMGNFTAAKKGITNNDEISKKFFS